MQAVWISKGRSGVYCRSEKERGKPSCVRVAQAGDWPDSRCAGGVAMSDRVEGMMLNVDMRKIHFSPTLVSKEGGLEVVRENHS